jgi:hypothetical protein
VKTLLFAFGTLVLVGCSGLKPVGPLAKEVPLTQQGKPLPDAPIASTAKPPSIRPTPPTMYVTPGDVNPNNPSVAANKLTSELDTDSKASLNAPVTAEVSRIQGRVK